MDVFPELAHAGNRIEIRDAVEPGTTGALILGGVIAAFVGLILCLVTYGVGLVLLLAYPLFAWYFHRKALARIHGSGIKLSDTQFPQIYRVVEDYAARLGIPTPEVYIVESSVINAYAVRHGRTNVVLLTDNIINACMMAGKPSALCYVLGHELGHIALGHNGLVRSFIASRYKKLSRLNEYSADRIALSLVHAKDDVLAGLIILTVGPQLSKFLNVTALQEQIKEVVDNTYSKKAESVLSHPLLLKRINRILAH